MMSNKIVEKKNQLLKASDAFEEAIDRDLAVVTETASEWGGRILVIGGAMLLSFLAVRAIIRKKKEDIEIPDIEAKASQIRVRNIFLKSLSDKAALVLLELLREYIIKLLKESSEEND